MELATTYMSIFAKSMQISVADFSVKLILAQISIFGKYKNPGFKFNRTKFQDLGICSIFVYDLI